MAQYFFDPEDYNIGDGLTELPFTVVRGSFTTFEIEDDGAGNKRLRIESGTNNSFAKWDDVPDALNVESYMRLEVTGTTTSSYYSPFAYRLDGAGDGYSFAVRGSSNLILVSAAGTLLTGNLAMGITWAGGDIIEVRRRAEDDGTDTTHMGKAWADGDPEPGSWADSAIDNTYTSSGAVGLGYITRTGLIYAFGVGTDGDAAPTEAVVASPDVEITSVVLTSDGGTVAASLEVEAQVAAALTTPGGTLAADAAVIASVAAALTSGGGTVAAEVFTSEIRQFSAALTSAGGALSAETAVLVGVAASIEGAGGTLSANAQVLSEVAATLEGAPGTIAAELDTIPLSKLSASLQGAPGTLAAELSRPPRLARLVVTLTDALQLNVTAKD